VPGEDHTLGITMAADMARDHGWHVQLLVGHSHEELAQVLTRRVTPVIGLSASTKQSLPALIKLMVALRISNPFTKIMICGQITTVNMNLDGITGADAIAGDFDSALAAMRRLIKPASDRRMGPARSVDVIARHAPAQLIHRLGQDGRLMGALIATGARADPAVDPDLGHARGRH
jgi:hypothetical protein